MLLMRLALRNIARNKRRTLLTLAAISFGFAMMIWTINLQGGQYEEMINKGISQLAGHVVIEEPTYRKDPKASKLLTDVSKLQDELADMFPGATLTPKIQMGGLLTSSTGSVGAALTAGDVTAEAKVGELDDTLVPDTEGNASAWIEPGDHRGIVIGVGLADKLQVDVGDKLVWMGQYGDAESTSRLFRLRGIFKMGVDEVDGNIAFTSLDAAQAILERPDTANSVAVHLTDGKSWPLAVEKAQSLATDQRRVLSWQQAVPQIAEMIEMDRSSSNIMLSIIGLIVALGVLNTVLMSAMERTKEFGVLLAVGLKPKQVSLLILLEGLFLGLIGTALGLLLGALLTWPTVEYGIDYSGIMGGERMENGGVAISTLMKASWTWGRMFNYAIASVVATTLAAVYPAWHVFGLKPVDAMRHV